MKRINTLIIWEIIFIPIFLISIISIFKLVFSFTIHSTWQSLVSWSITVLLAMACASVIYQSLLKLLETINKQQLEENQLKNEKEIAELHHQSRNRELEYAIEKCKLDYIKVKKEIADMHNSCRKKIIEFEIEKNKLQNNI